MPTTLNMRETRLVDLYVTAYLSGIKINETALSKRAGYAAKSAHVTVSRALRKDKIQKAIDAEIEKRTKNSRISESIICTQYIKIALNDKESTTNQLHALDSLARTKAMFSERQIVAIETPTLSPAEVLRYRQISAALDRPALAPPNIPADVLDSEQTDDDGGDS